MTITFPSSIGSAPLAQQGYKEGIVADPTVRSPMDSGQPKARPRYSAVCKSFEGQIELLSSADCDAIFSFYDSDCVFGSLPFVWEHPRTHASGNFKWQERPAIAGTQGVTFTMSVKFMSIPVPV